MGLLSLDPTQDIFTIVAKGLFYQSWHILAYAEYYKFIVDTIASLHTHLTAQTFHHPLVVPFEASRNERLKSATEIPGS